MAITEQVGADRPLGSPFPPDVLPAVEWESPPVSSRAAWTSVAVLLVLSVTSMLDRQIIALLTEPMKADLQLSDTQFGLLQGLRRSPWLGLVSVYFLFR